MQFSKDVSAISRYFRRRRNQYMEAFGLKSIHALYLIDVCQSPGISQDKLAQRQGIDKSNVARQVAILEEKALLIRKPSAEDKRMLCLFPTEKTLTLLPSLQEAMQDWENAALGGLSTEEKKQLLTLIAKVRLRTEGSGTE